MFSTPVWDAASISITSTWRDSIMDSQCLPSPGMWMVGPVPPLHRLVIQAAGKDARGRRLANAADAGEHPGLRNAAGRKGVGDGADHRLLADQVVEGTRPVFSRENAIRCRGGLRFRRQERGLDVQSTIVRNRALLEPRTVRKWLAVARVGHVSRSVANKAVRLQGRPEHTGRSRRWHRLGGWTKTRSVSLGLLPSGSDPVGE